MRRTQSDTNPGDVLTGDSRDERRIGPREHRRRRSLLCVDPAIDVVDMAMLVDIARAIEDEAVRRYALLAELMDSRGEPATASAFRAMAEEEKRHVAAVDRWARGLGDPAPAGSHYDWELPADLSGSWDEVAASALLSPYRAFAIAVENEERAFAFYAYLAAHAATDRIRAEAEKLGAEELRHAALMRRWRRRAYHAEQRSAGRAAQSPIESAAALHEMVARHLAATVQVHHALARRLRRAGDETSAVLLEGFGTQAGWAAGVAVSTPSDGVAKDVAATPGTDDPRHLLIDAQKPLEALTDQLEAVMATAEGGLFEEAATVMDRVVAQIAQLAFRIGSLGDG